MAVKGQNFAGITVPPG